MSHSTHQWIKYTPLNPPPQGKKIVCFRKGDLWIARMIKFNGTNYWIEIQYDGMNSMKTDAPDYWMDLDLPEGYTGYLRLGINGKSPKTFDEMELEDPEYYQDFAQAVISIAKTPRYVVDNERYSTEKNENK